MMTRDIPANIEPFVSALGVEDAVRLFLAMGGSQIYLPQRSSPHSLTARTIGPDKVEKLAAALGCGYIKVPLARQWIAGVMQENGDSLAEIARTVRADVATVRRWLGPSSADTQLSLL
jgi:hypothetical protein